MDSLTLLYDFGKTKVLQRFFIAKGCKRKHRFLQVRHFNGSFFYHSPSGKDREIIKKMPEYTAMMNLASYVEGIHLGIMFDDLPVSIEYMVNESIEIIRKIVKDNLEDIDKINLPDLYCYADMILEKELKES